MEDTSKLPPSLGLGKTLFNSSVCLIDSKLEPEILLTERHTRVKASGHWPKEVAQKALQKFSLSEKKSDEILLTENRDVIHPHEYEDALDKTFPFKAHLKKQEMGFLLSENKDLSFISHHFAHALSSLFMSPFEKSVILVMDGAGSKSEHLQGLPGEKMEGPFKKDQLNAGMNEECSIYLQDGPVLKPVYKSWQTFQKDSRSDHYYSEGLGTAYEKAAEYIFKKKTASGKVMGLAAFQNQSSSKTSLDFLKALDWSQSFQGKGKAEWENSPSLKSFEEIAGEIQAIFENRYGVFISEIRKHFPEYTNIILAGGCALNCTNNAKILDSGEFEQIFVPPFPGDEGISLGCAFYPIWKNHPQLWKKREAHQLVSYFGDKNSLPTNQEIEKVFEGYTIHHPNSLTDFVTDLLLKEEVIAWFQGRSECGPRALGNRSILCRPDKQDAKQYLNDHIKFRESFRPYGCSVPQEKASLYFQVSSNFENPFMSFACKVQRDFKEQLKEVSHVDGTSRMQTVREGQNPLFHQLLQSFGEKSGLYCLLNTSLNIMGEPIVETLTDAKNFLDNTPVHGLAIEDYYVERKS